MSRVSQTSLEEVKERADIVEVVRAHTPLQRRGAEWTGRCPFHEERSPSFWVNPDTKLYYCFGCEAKGDLIGFVCEAEGLDFAGAVELAGRPLRRRAAVRRARPEGRGAALPRGAAVRAPAHRRGVLRADPVGAARGRAGPGVPRGARHRARDGSNVRARVLPRRVGAGGEGGARARVLRPRAAGRGPVPAVRPGPRDDRPLPRPADVPAARRPRPGRRLRRPPAAAVRGRAEVPELARGAGLAQGRHPVRPRPGQAGDRPARPGDRRRGLHRRPRDGAGGDPERRRLDGHVADRAAAARAAAAEPERRPVLRRRRGRGRRRAARAAARGAGRPRGADRLAAGRTRPGRRRDRRSGVRRGGDHEGQERPRVPGRARARPGRPEHRRRPRRDVAAGARGAVGRSAVDRAGRAAAARGGSSAAHARARGVARAGLAEGRRARVGPAPPAAPTTGSGSSRRTALTGSEPGRGSRRTRDPGTVGRELLH